MGTQIQKLGKSAGRKEKNRQGLRIGRRMGGFQIFNFKMLFMKLYIQSHLPWFMFKGGKLKFKGSSSSSNKSINTSQTSVKKEKEDVFVLPKEITSLPDEGWTKATDPEDFLGPIIFIIPGDSASLLKVGEENGNLTLETCEGDEPKSTANVLVGQNLIPQVFSFKSAFGKYLTTDSLGQVACNKEAVSPLAEWTLIIKPEGVSLEGVNQKFLSFDPKTERLRCDSDTIGFNETFIVKCQADRKKSRLIEKFQAEKRSSSKSLTSHQELSLLEETEAKKMQSFGLSRNKTTSNNPASSDLKRAAEEGNLRETLLERRIKSKHDPFC